MKSMVKIQEMTFAYPSPKGVAPPVLRGINLSIPRGRYVAMMGPNGSGKSTLGKIIKGLLTPSSGQIWIGGLPLRAGEISGQVGYIFSNPENQIVSSLVEEEVAFGLGNRGINPSVMSQRVEESLRLVGMEAYRFHSPHLLSGGQQQKVVIAGVLAMECDLLVLDEPTSMLDLGDRAEILDLFKKIHASGDKTLLLITHSLEEALEAQDLIYLQDGQISFRGSPEDLLTKKPLPVPSEIHFPPLLRLIQGLRERGHSIPPGVRSLEELKNFFLHRKDR